MEVTDLIVDAIHEVMRNGFKPTSIELGVMKTMDFKEALQDVVMCAAPGHTLDNCDGEFHGLPVHFHRSPGIAVTFIDD